MNLEEIAVPSVYPSLIDLRLFAEIGEKGQNIASAIVFFTVLESYATVDLVAPYRKHDNRRSIVSRLDLRCDCDPSDRRGHKLEDLLRGDFGNQSSRGSRLGRRCGRRRAPRQQDLSNGGRRQQCHAAEAQKAFRQ